MSTAALSDPPPLDIDGFLRFLDAQPSDRWELHEGVPVEMVRPTYAHARLVSNILVGLIGPARAAGFDAVTDFLIEADRRSGYAPDVAVISGSLDPTSRRSSEPVIIVEVLSPTTMDFDRAGKAPSYKAIPSLRQLVLVYQDSVRVESWTRSELGWPSRPDIMVERTEALSCPSIATSLELSRIYDRVIPSPLMD